MTITSFLHLVELKTKAASVIPFLIGSCCAFYLFGSFNLINAIIMFMSTLIFDMTTTAINNYIDHVSAVKKEGYGYETHNAIGRYQLKISQVRLLIISMLLISILLGLWLTLRTDLIVLLLGMICFAIGILYTYGPLPISRTPFGELFSGVTMGLILTFISIYIHVYDQKLLVLSLSIAQLDLSLQLKPLGDIVLICLPLVCTIADIMLANNLCDMEDDLINRRYTLPLYLGREKGLWIWQALYIISYAALLLSAILGIIPRFALLCLITWLPVSKNIQAFKSKQEKKTTFILAVKNFMIINGSYLLTLLAGCLLKIYH